MEKAYFEGQFHAVHGDIRIEEMPDGSYVWSKSPWGDKHWPEYVPVVRDTVKYITDIAETIRL